jgi:beta-lactamase regulating signal transducer with metallopeptidase domain
MLGWSAQTTVIAMVLAAIAILASRSRRLGPAARHVLWLVVLIKLLSPPVLNWPWSPPALWSTPNLLATPAPVADAPAANVEPIVAEQEPVDLDDWLENEGRPESTAPVEAPERPATAAIPAPPAETHWNFDSLGQGLFALWLGISATIAAWQIVRIVRFHRQLAWVLPAPEWLVREVRDLSAQIGVRAPEILVVPAIAPPMLWFLGRTKLLVPGRLVANADRVPADRLGLRAVLAHELAHLRRGDHWVRRLDFFASLIWWWNPIYWLTRERLSIEAELACDEWAIRAVPEGRVSYAEALLDVCRTLSTTKSPAPALGVVGAGRFLERRVKMILQHQAPSRISMPVLLGAGLLFLVALPGWSAAGSAATRSPSNSGSKDDKNLVSSATIGNAKVVALKDDDDDDDKKEAAEEKREAEAEERDAEAQKKDAKAHKKEAEALKREAQAAKEEARAAKEEIARELKKELGPGSDFQKEMKNLGKELSKELGPGSEFEKEMKKLGPQLQKELGPGSDFEKEMKSLTDDMQKQFGPGSEFQKNLMSKAQEIEKQFGPGSEFEQRMKRFGEQMAKKYGEGSEFAEKMKKAAKDEKDAKATSDNPSEKREKAKHKAHKSKKEKHSTSKSQDLKALRAQIEELNAQLKKLEAADKDKDKDDDEEEEE